MGLVATSRPIALVTVHNTMFARGPLLENVCPLTSPLCTYVHPPKAFLEDAIPTREVPMFGHETHWLVGQRAMGTWSWHFGEHDTTWRDIVVVDGWLVLDFMTDTSDKTDVCGVDIQSAMASDRFFDWSMNMSAAMHDVWGSDDSDEVEIRKTMVVPCPQGCCRTWIRMPYLWERGTLGGFDDLPVPVRVDFLPWKPLVLQNIQQCHLGLSGPLKAYCPPVPREVVCPGLLAKFVGAVPSTGVMELPFVRYDPLFLITVSAECPGFGCPGLGLDDVHVLDVDIVCTATGNSFRQNLVLTTHSGIVLVWVAPHTDAVPCREWLTTQRWGLDVSGIKRFGFVCHVRFRGCVNVYVEVKMFGHMRLTQRF